MLKKAGIIAAVAATGVLAMSSLAFADTSSGNLGNDCAFGNESGSAGQIQDGGSGLFGGVLSNLLGTVTNAATQANTGNCNNLNVEDIIDQDSNNTTNTVDRTSVEDSFNQHHRSR